MSGKGAFGETPSPKHTGVLNTLLGRDKTLDPSGVLVDLRLMLGAFAALRASVKVELRQTGLCPTCQTLLLSLSFLKALLVQTYLSPPALERDGTQDLPCAKGSSPIH